jgi:ABC-2 type transport system ATP-binding protein
MGCVRFLTWFVTLFASRTPVFHHDLKHKKFVMNNNFRKNWARYNSTIARRRQVKWESLTRLLPAIREPRTWLEVDMPAEVVSVLDFRKSYDKFAAVAGISFTVTKGEIFGLLGPNGAGKTSTLECLEGIRQPDPGAGRMRILDVDPQREPGRLRNLIGVQLQTSGLPATMTVEEAMRFFCAYHGLAPRFDLLERMQLAEKTKTQYHQLSTGQQRRLALALAIAHRPPLVILDEPTAGLDVASRTELHNLMQELKSTGTTIILATHDMAEAEKMTDRVAILLRGKIVATGSPRDLTATGSGLTKVSVRSEVSSLQNNGVEFPSVQQHGVQEEYAIYYSTDPGPTVAAILDFLNLEGDRLIDLRVERPSLEERFLEITSEGKGQ